MTTRNDVTGLVLAGGRGSRMGGVDKGLQLLDGVPLVQHALRRLAPQVASLMINANRNLEVYAQFGVPVWPDAESDFAGPLAGFVAGLAHCATEWLVTVPCDTPRFPLDLVERMTKSVGTARVAVACTTEEGAVQRQPVFCLMRRDTRADIVAYLAGGGRKIDTWFDREGCVDVLFEDADAFYNANTAEELRRLGPT
ncbi:MAG TPA: molybdenum cofactor guanylyltransferase MobA [Burkholderiaceae bacterium]|nr:molybdenum cofactor guanylyltransferase MobA [Burkholderiaceae bacterium]